MPRWPGVHLVVLTLLILGIGSCDRSAAGPEPLVVYCAHDQTYAEAILDDFERETGIPLQVKYDTEATKSLGLTRLIESEAEAPRCDVFWNNQLLGTAALAEQGLLVPYRGTGWERIPDQYKDARGRYVGFGGRLRVWIVNTDAMQATPEAVRVAMARDDLSRVAVAQPMFGTTLTHYTVLWDALGPGATRAWHASIQARGVIQQGGNARVKNLVAGGVCDLGLTDTDDYFVAVDAGQPVAMVAYRVGETEGGERATGATICIPNTVAIVKGGDSPAARRLADYLASAEVELAMARSRSRQVPLGPVDESELPEQVRALRPLVTQGYPLEGLVDERAACLEWLASERLR